MPRRAKAREAVPATKAIRPERPKEATKAPVRARAATRRARDQGRVIIEIVVDQQGKVTSASYRSKGSTTQNSSLVNSALRAARQARFNVDENAPLSQRGTITYNFRMQ